MTYLLQRGRKPLHPVQHQFTLKMPIHTQDHDGNVTLKTEKINKVLNDRIILFYIQRI